MNTITYPHIEINADGVPMVSGTTTKVVEIVLDHLAYHWPAEEIHRQHSYLSLAQIHASLTYYYDHQQAMDDDIEARMRCADEIKQRLGDSKVRDKLVKLGYLPRRD